MTGGLMVTMYMTLEECHDFIFAHGCPMCGSVERKNHHFEKFFNEEKGGHIEGYSAKFRLRLYCRSRNQQRYFNPEELELQKILALGT